jgi:DNA-binding response OmpR family regulator
MKRARIIIVESDGRLADRLQALADERQWTLREVTKPERCLRLLERGTKTIVVIRLGETPTAELALLTRIHELPHVRTVAVGSHENADVINGLAWDLGADFTLCPPMAMDLLPKIVAGLLDSPVTPQIAKQ